MNELVLLGLGTLIGIVGFFGAKLINKVDAIADGLQGIKETQIKQGLELQLLKDNWKQLTLKKAH